jgi:peptidoglycan/LPS O-acetylase OafA/YrhL
LIIPVFLYALGNLFLYDSTKIYSEGNPPAHYSFELLNYIFHPINFEFALGAILYYLFDKKIKFNPYVLIAIYIISFIATNYVVSPDLQNVFTFFRPIFYGLPACCLIYGFLWLDIKLNKFVAFLVLLGDASYVLYLVHNSILSVMIRFILMKFQNPYIIGLGGAVIVVIICWVSILLYKYVEKPVMKVINNLFIR